MKVYEDFFCFLIKKAYICTMKIIYYLLVILIVASCTGRYLLYESSINCIYDYSVYYETNSERVVIIFKYPIKLDESNFLMYDGVKIVTNENNTQYNLYFTEENNNQSDIQAILKECVKKIDKQVEQKCITP